MPFSASSPGAVKAKTVTGIMLLGQADLFKEAVKFESKELKENKFHPAFMSELEALLLDVYTRLLPTATEYEQRKQLVQAFNISVKSTFGNIGGFPVVEAFGSFIMNIFTATSDLDLSINFNNSRAICLPRDQAVSVLRSFAKVLYKGQRKGHLSGVLPVLYARVPVLKAVDCKTGIECDISVENKDGISRSLFFSIISSVDERFRIMSYLMKAWAKANDINSSKDRTMNSLSIISLVAFHFQTRDPPILPPFSTLLGDGTDVTNLRNVVLDFKNFGVRNKESVAELFVSLLAKLSSVEKLWELGLCASTFEGSWISKTWASKVGIMSVEDFLDRSQNFARSVGKSEMPKIYDCLRGSLKHLTLSMQGQIDLSALRSALFGSISFDALGNHVNSNAAEIIKLKLTVQPRVDINNKINNANSTAGVERKQTNRKSATHHTNSSIGMTLKRKLPGDESVQPQFKNITSKRTRYTEATGASRFGSHQSQSTTYLPNPIRYPVLHYAPPQPINGVGYLPHRDRDPKPPIAPNMGHAPHYLVYESQYHSTAPHPVQHVYGSQGLQYVPNPVHPAILNSRYPNILPGYNGHNTGHHNLLVPPRSFGSNHL